MDTRICKVCGIEKPFDYAAWVCSKGKPIGLICRACNRAKSLTCHTEKRQNDTAWREQRKVTNNANNKQRYWTNAQWRKQGK